MKAAQGIPQTFEAVAETHQAMAELAMMFARAAVEEREAKLQHLTMLYSEFDERLTANLAQHDLTVPALLSLPEFKTLSTEQRSAIIASIHSALGDHPELLHSWMLALATFESALSPAHLLHDLIGLVSLDAEKGAAESVAGRSAEVERVKADTTRAVEEAVAAAKAEAKADTTRAVAEAVAAAKAEATRAPAAFKAEATRLQTEAVNKAKADADCKDRSYVQHLQNTTRPNCVVCFAAEADRMPFGCQHVSMCEACADKTLRCNNIVHRP